MLIDDHQQSTPRTATVVRVTPLSRTIRELALWPDDGIATWSPGSHLTISVNLQDRGPETEARAPARPDVRHYSLVGLPDADVYRIAVKRIEPGRGGSRFVWRLVEGDRIRIGTPGNHFELPSDARGALLIAGGIGITPMLGMALTLAARGGPFAMRYAARSAAELVYVERLRAALGSRLRTLTDDAGERIDLDAEIATLAGDARLIVCGPHPLLEAARDAWLRAGRSVDRLHFETFGASGSHPSEPFWVEVRDRGTRLQVGADCTLLDALNQAGVETLHDCLRGECGLCAVDVVAVDGEIDHRDVFLSSEEKRSNRRLCACVSRVAGGGIVIDSGYRPEVRADVRP